MSQTPTSCYGWTSTDTLSTFSTWTPSRTGGSVHRTLHYHTEKQRFHANYYHFSPDFLREIKLSGTVGAVVPVEGSKDLIVTVERKIIRINRDTG